MSLESLYQELILDHARHPHGKRPLDGLGEREDGLGEREDGSSSATSHQRNPICGDEITLRALVHGDILREVTWEGDGCSISQASASMLAALVAEEDGMPRAEASALIAGFREALRSRGSIPLDEETFGDAAALSGVSRYTARVKCAMLAWVALEDALGRA